MFESTVIVEIITSIGVIIAGYIGYRGINKQTQTSAQAAKDENETKLREIQNTAIAAQATNEAKLKEIQTDAKIAQEANEAALKKIASDAEQAKDLLASQYIKLSIDLLKAEKTPPKLRIWALKVINEYSKVKIAETEGELDALANQEASLF